MAYTVPGPTIRYWFKVSNEFLKAQKKWIWFLNNDDVK